MDCTCRDSGWGTIPAQKQLGSSLEELGWSLTFRFKAGWCCWGRRVWIFLGWSSSSSRQPQGRGSTHAKECFQSLYILRPSQVLLPQYWRATKLQLEFSWDSRKVQSHHCFHWCITTLKLVLLPKSRLPWTFLCGSSHECYRLLPSHGRFVLASVTLHLIRASAEPLRRRSSTNSILRNWLKSLRRFFKGGDKALGYVVNVQNLAWNFFHRKLVTQQKWCRWCSYRSIRNRNWPGAFREGAEQKESCIALF